MATRLVRLHKDIGMAQSAMGTGQSYEELIKNDPTAALAAFNAQWDKIYHRANA